MPTLNNLKTIVKILKIAKIIVISLKHIWNQLRNCNDDASTAKPAVYAPHDEKQRGKRPKKEPELKDIIVNVMNYY